jgi:hypothetical protein
LCQKYFAAPQCRTLRAKENISNVLHTPVAELRLTRSAGIVGKGTGVA